MITGDHLVIAVETAKMLNLGDEVPGSDTVAPLIRTAEGLLSTVLYTTIHFFFCIKHSKTMTIQLFKTSILLCLLFEFFSFCTCSGLPLLDMETKKAPADMVALYGEHIRREGI